MKEISMKLRAGERSLDPYLRLLFDIWDPSRENSSFRGKFEECLKDEKIVAAVRKAVDEELVKIPHGNLVALRYGLGEGNLTPRSDLLIATEYIKKTGDVGCSGGNIQFLIRQAMRRLQRFGHLDPIAAALEMRRLESGLYYWPVPNEELLKKPPFDGRKMLDPDTARAWASNLDKRLNDMEVSVRWLVDEIRLYSYTFVWGVIITPGSDVISYNFVSAVEAALVPREAKRLVELSKELMERRLRLGASMVHLRKYGSSEIPHWEDALKAVEELFG